MNVFVNKIEKAATLLIVFVPQSYEIRDCRLLLGFGPPEKVSSKEEAQRGATPQTYSDKIGAF